MKITKIEIRSKLDREIDDLIDYLSSVDKESDTYAAVAANLETLYRIKGTKTKKTVSPDTLAVVAGNLLGICLIMKYEELNIITTKALGFVIKGRV